MKRLVAAIVCILVALLATVVWLAMSEPDAAPTSDPPAPPSPPKAVRKRGHAAADAAAPATQDSKETPPPADAASLAVHVVAAAGGKPVKGASVAVTDADCEAWSVATDAEGAALFATLPPGATEVTVETKGFLAATKTIVLKAREKSEVDLSLDAAAALEGVLIDAATGAPIADAEVEVVAKDPATGDERVLGDARTDEKGAYRVESVPAGGSATLRVRGASGRVRTVGVALGGTQSERIVIPAEMSGRVTGFVRDSDGHDVARASVMLREPTAPQQAPPRLVAETGPNGAYAFADVPPDVELVAMARASGWADSAPSAPFRLSIAAAETTRDLTVRRPASLRVTYEFAEGDEKPPLVFVRLDDEGAATTTYSYTGFAVRPNLTPGPHRVRVAADGFLPEERHVELTEGAELALTVRFRRGLEIAGTVLDAQGRAIDGAVVIATDPDLPADARSLRQDWAQTTKVAGRDFRLGGLLPRKYCVFAYVPNGPESALVPLAAPATGVQFVLARGTRISLHVILPAGFERPARVLADAFVEQPAANLPSDFAGALRVEPLAWSETSTLESEVGTGNAWLRVRVAGFAPAVLPIALQPGRLVDAGELRLEPAVSVKGHVVDAAGSGVRGVAVWATLTDESAAVKSWDDGEVAVGGLAPGAAILRARAEGRFGAAAADAGGAPATVVLHPTGTVAGVVADQNGVPVRDAVVAVRHGFSGSPLDRGQAESTSADAEGRFKLRVASGRVRVCAGGEWVETNVPEGGEAEVTVRRP